MPEDHDWRDCPNAFKTEAIANAVEGLKLELRVSYKNFEDINVRLTTLESKISDHVTATNSFFANLVSKDDVASLKSKIDELDIVFRSIKGMFIAAKWAGYIMASIFAAHQWISAYYGNK